MASLRQASLQTLSTTSGSAKQFILRDSVPEPPAAPTACSTFTGHPKHAIEFRHPGYPDEHTKNVILTLKAFDDTHAALHHATARIACAIVACNRWDGYLARTRDGGPIDLKEDDLLTDPVYFFKIPDAPDDRYPVFPNFDNWEYPHGNFPSNWRSMIPKEDDRDGEFSTSVSVSNLSGALLNRDNGCVISRYYDYCEKAHLCPVNELAWFKRNEMHTYNENDQLLDRNIIDDISNVVALRPDVHKAFDEKKFVLVPKLGKWVVHFTAATRHLGQLYHNTPLDLHKNVSPSQLFTRFAWAIFPSVLKFLEGGVGREVLVRTSQNGKHTWRTETVPPEDAAKRFGPPGSPKKRKLEWPTELQPGLDLSTPLPFTIKRARMSSSSPKLPSDFSPSDFSSFSDALSIPSEKQSHLQTPPETVKNPSETPSTPAVRKSVDDMLTVGDSTVETPTKYNNKTDVHPNPHERLDKARAEWVEYNKMRLEALLKQRPSDPSIYCCDYRAAEAAATLGIEGLREWDGGHLCNECLGVEYLEDRDKSLPPWHDEEETNCV
ncbi:hypothetical protein B0A49_08189 [Cryomyces minteri]|uniref:HNH nuclease domain-containing protein n=1 Tax=Cryomyces minteri TaxID=331657 RepID=A0A4U0XSI7_9PEZI|nr:hypothetical protein B0A49_08189 [Cryomyces minteri]